MSTWKVNSKSTQISATYTEGDYKVEVSYTEDATTSTLTNINGSFYKGESMTYAGNFNGNVNGGNEMSYSFREVRLADMGAVTEMVADIESKISEEG